jgi:soluble lytic murein transglycosylase-like protein
VLDPEIASLISKYAEIEDVDPAIVYGICKQESGFNQYAARFERTYPYLFNPSQVKPAMCSLDTEVACQRMSWGLMQMMGAVFRELGYIGWLTQISGDVETQIEYGTQFLAQKIKKYGLEGGISAYNGGIVLQSNYQTYVRPVLAYAKEWVA